MELSTIRFVENKENVVFLGSHIVGKIHLAFSYEIIAAQYRYSTYYTNCHNLYQGSLWKQASGRLKNYTKYKILIVDEIGYLPRYTGSKFVFSFNSGKIW